MKKIYVTRDRMTQVCDAVLVDGNYREYLPNYSMKSLKRLAGEYDCDIEEVDKLPD